MRAGGEPGGEANCMSIHVHINYHVCTPFLYLVPSVFLQVGGAVPGSYSKDPSLFRDDAAAIKGMHHCTHAHTNTQTHTYIIIHPTPIHSYILLNLIVCLQPPQLNSSSKHGKRVRGVPLKVRAVGGERRGSFCSR